MNRRTIQRKAMLWWMFIWLGALTELTGSAASNSIPWLQCDREMRRTLEAIQAWRRTHDGQYPGRLVDLLTSDLMQAGGEICPQVRNESVSGDAYHNVASSVGEDRDPPGTYEYEMSDRVLKSESDRRYLPPDAGDYTRQELKSELLKRPYFEQVPILRCTSHGSNAPPPFSGKSDIRRNATVEGNIYWGRLHWEQLWLADVPYCAREANVLFGLKGPPFHTDLPPELPQALDLRKWSCAFGDHAWWWTFPIFEEYRNRQIAAHLRPFFEEKHGRSMTLGDEQWWLDGLAQLQGRILSKTNLYRGPTMEAFVSEKTGVKVARTIHGASWLQGTVWTAPMGETAGWLIWHYEDGQSERVPLIYGQNIARFWGDLAQIKGENNYPEPVWKHYESAETVLKERWLRLYRQSWTNPRPQSPVATLDFVSNTNSSAAPFLISVNVKP